MPTAIYRASRCFRIGPARVDDIRCDELVSAIGQSARERQGLRASYVNAHVFELLHRNRVLQEAHARLELIFCDGFGAFLGFRLLGAPIPERMTPPDFIDEILERVADHGGRVFLLGDEARVVDLAAKKMNSRWPFLVVGTHHGYFEPEAIAAIDELVRASGADLLLVAMGTPRQELWLADLDARLPGLTALAVGGLFRWSSGFERRGPRWLTDHGFEWLCRLVVQPRRVASRYFIGLPRFALRILGLLLRGERAQLESKACE